jgi:8-oxo-dGTP pyrophosphatase MutT (NUDIX family)
VVEWEKIVMPRKIDIIWDEGWFGTRSAGVMLDERNRVLLCRLEDDDIWVLPGGGMVLHETSEETVRREFFEEANFEVNVHKLLWIEENYFVFNEKKVHGIGFYFLVSPKDATGVWEQDEFFGQEEEISPSENWTLIFKWFNTSELDELNLKPSYLKKVLKNIPEHPVHIVHHDI